MSFLWRKFVIFKIFMNKMLTIAFKEKKGSNKSNTLTVEEVTVPSDVMIEIFSRLPARSVGRFRSISKLYYRLLSQPIFIQKHLLHGGVKLLVHMGDQLYDDEKKGFIYYPFSSFDKNLTLHGSEVKYPSYPYPGNLLLLGSCNGLFCFTDEDNNRVMLWNPTTREIYCLPELPNTILNNNSGEETNYDYALAYDSLNEDFKVVCVMIVSDCKQKFPKIPSTKTHIYSHRSRRWKEIQPFPNIRGMIWFCRNIKFVHNKIHWLPYCLQVGNASQFIVSLDLATETYGEIRQPNYHRRVPADRHGTARALLSVLGGELCVSINYIYENDFQVWMMNEYGVEQSWCRVLSICDDNLVFSPEKMKAIFEPLFLMESGEVLLMAYEGCTSSIYLYNPRSCSFITVYSGPYSAIVYRHTPMSKAWSN